MSRRRPSQQRIVAQLVSKYTLSALVVLVTIWTVHRLSGGRSMKMALLDPLLYLHHINLTTENSCGRRYPCSARR